ncbi:adenosine deaminase [Propioniferax innocua]|uniref:adenosine deaminase n=1 Tax=Propioniferax innocua TaxID=1753 RepID=A0A542ZRU4_9ACTN|nr:adenosine deaminase [Propioniferax innocua]TQL63078.1 adenosine deaminase [Propioniferax innocua]
MTDDLELTTDVIRALPKVSLHDHLDGGLRPSTLVDLAEDAGHELPTTDPEELGEWFFNAANSGSLPRYLETFAHTTAAMQTADGLRRVAKEWVLDQAADGVVLAEARWAPEQHLTKGLTLHEAVDAVAAGLTEGMDEARLDGVEIVASQIITAMRHADRSPEIADLYLDRRDDPSARVVGFDIAGAEDGFPPSKHTEAFARLRENLANITIHAAEAAGVDSLRDALTQGAQRIGHGVRVVEDIDLSGSIPRLGRVASFVRDHRIPLEVCPSSNLQTGATSTDLSQHPVRLLDELGFTLTINCDNRLLGRTSLTAEFQSLVETFGYELDDLKRFTANAAWAAFTDVSTADRIIERLHTFPTVGD